MKVLYLIRDGRDATLDAIIAAQARDNDVSVLDLGVEHDFDKVMRQIENAQKVVSW